MLDKLERLAHFSVGRAVGFASIAVVMCFLALAGDLVAALKCTGVLTLLITMVLLLKARLAPGQNYKRTELWILLKPPERPHPEVAQQIIGTVLRETYLMFALHSGLIAAGCFGASLLLGLLR